jgi:hypothetical protein
MGEGIGLRLLRFARCVYKNDIFSVGSDIIEAICAPCSDTNQTRFPTMKKYLSNQHWHGS